ncbi:hypothetical protein [Acetobacter aceti]|uniref:Uncharacterized protein n=1 Tax=Acetobacter aceti TaxID=435 RepID=A0A6S6PHD1_ACEAC|nr:hypothetical protein [Acetobacter aceti]BCI66011.1 hypothetical protein AAJCM20276_06350 [Acetobacter aceti]
MRKRGRPPIFENAMSNRERQQRKERRKKQQFIQSMEAVSELGSLVEQVLFLNTEGSDLSDRIRDIQETIRTSEYGLSAVDLHRNRQKNVKKSDECSDMVA